LEIFRVVFIVTVKVSCGRRGGMKKNVRAFGNIIIIRIEIEKKIWF